MPRIFIDGSSTAYGLWGGKEGGWADRVKFAHMPNKPDQAGGSPMWTVHNLATPHRMVTEITAQLPGFMENYRRNTKALVAVVMAGQVESRYTSGSPEPDIPLEQFKDSLRKLATLAISETSALILLGTTPVVADKAMSVGRFACRYDMEQRFIYDAAISEVAAEADAPYVHLMTPLLSAQEAGEVIMDDDGLHPNARGHAILYDIVHPVVEREAVRLQTANAH